MQANWLSVIDAAYDLESSEEVWLGALLDAARRLMPPAPHAYAATYDASDPSALRIEHVVLRDFATAPCATASQMLGPAFREKLSLSSFAKYGVRDSFGVNAIDPTGHGCLPARRAAFACAGGASRSPAAIRT